MVTESAWDALPSYVRLALEAIHDGATADSQESLILEFKEDPTAREGKGGRAKLVEKLLNEAICMANSEAATGHIVVGVADRTPGAGAFTGTELGEEDIARRIFNGTKPNMNVQVTAVYAWGARLVVIHVPEARALYTRGDGAAKRRTADSQFSCQPMTEELRRAIDAARRDPDYSNDPADITVDDLQLPVIEEARRMLREHRRSRGSDAAVPQTTTGLLRELGLMRDDGQLKRAAEILLAQPNPTDVVVRHLWRSIPGQEPQATLISDPLLLALPRLRRLIAENGDREIERVQFEDGEEVAISRFPSQAVDEAVSNAFIHRDWRLPGPVVVEQTNRTLKITSPGPLPPGVTVDTLLSTPSVPRNNRLMAAMRTLGLAEESSRGFDRMWTTMIRTGRSAPEVTATEANVQVVLAAQQPDTNFIKGLRKLSERFGEEVVDSVAALIVLWHLNSAPLITATTAAQKTQLTTLEVHELMDDLVARGLLDPVTDADEWTLSGEARKLLNLGQPGDLATVSVQEWIEAKLHDGAALQSADIADQTGVSVAEAGRILRHLRSLGRAKIDPDGPPRGRGTRWIRA
ncbi:putative DNA binding domain-containing protein [Corynebacterium sp. MC-17D]|uniref:DNA binding domain-containing protein n=1 Tax=Corynebacterium lipophilum TaxID=2804918 RepID=A0AAW5HWQ1_9CORY|nr:ATP-binding protein [Corynebacterium lipophilum]MCO6394619.1 putative DNA binding domain-containing protein [Corynebacterium lipophilum]MCZ2117160.1 putative DNA binding domain-containing protein [Corynebacterium lipophilum]